MRRLASNRGYPAKPLPRAPFIRGAALDATGSALDAMGSGKHNTRHENTAAQTRRHDLLRRYYYFRLVPPAGARPRSLPHDKTEKRPAQTEGFACARPLKPDQTHRGPPPAKHEERTRVAHAL